MAIQQTRHADVPIYRTYWGAMRPEDFKDKTGKTWTIGEVLSRDLRDFVYYFDGNYRTAMDIYCFYAEIAKKRKKSELSIREQRIFDRLDSMLFDFERSFYPVARELSVMRSGTRLLGGFAISNAQRELELLKVVMNWKKHGYCSRQYWDRAVQQVELRFSRDLAEKSARNSRAISEFNFAAYEAARAPALRALKTLYHLGPDLPPWVRRQIADRFYKLAQLVDDVMRT